jgi:hypothetical protein
MTERIASQRALSEIEYFRQQIRRDTWQIVIQAVIAAAVAFAAGAAWAHFFWTPGGPVG